MNGKKKTMRAVIEIIIAVLVIIAVYFIIRGMDRHDVCIRQAATEGFCGGIFAAQTAKL